MESFTTTAIIVGVMIAAPVVIYLYARAIFLAWFHVKRDYFFPTFRRSSNGTKTTQDKD